MHDGDADAGVRGTQLVEVGRVPGRVTQGACDREGGVRSRGGGGGGEGSGASGGGEAGIGGWSECCTNCRLKSDDI